MIKHKEQKQACFYYINQLTSESKPKAIEIHEDGRFKYFNTGWYNQLYG